ncbi:hypothetical protein RB25_23120 [Herbaspirillum rubrisubalbicans]|uniref:Uncharacterized protein n=1 Tax=Herbaspirillum rubrisubalbicans TaxID=80842 RepID=A0ABX9BXK9_9BURK|nr:hypothetical protein [Herbaspirillum rubrisubalbicans]RAM62622.1 hypothetical protein RB24_20125 [Herbaspirillum rubrisubalbicans]RAN43658.1 hypothetical protein RB25_23120 [Herbaspirillum rubrisubalbicans]
MQLMVFYLTPPISLRPGSRLHREFARIGEQGQLIQVVHSLGGLDVACRDAAAQQRDQEKKCAGVSPGTRREEALVHCCLMKSSRQLWDGLLAIG